MHDLIGGLLLYEMALDFFDEAIDSEVATMYTRFHDWKSVDLEKLSEVILEGFDYFKLAQSDITFSDQNIKSFKNNDIPMAMKETLRKFNVTIETKIEDDKLWIRAK